MKHTLEQKTGRTPPPDRSSQTSGPPTGDPLIERVRVWLRTAADRKVVLRGVAYSVVVGAILVAINHGDAILGGRVDASRWVRIALTVLVPYCVSTASSVGAILEQRSNESAPDDHGTM